MNGIKTISLKKIKTPKGDIYKFLSKQDKYFKRFGEIYFSFTNPQSIKAWHMHKEMTLNYVCIEGKVKSVLYDDREKSKTRGKTQELILKEMFLGFYEHHKYE